MTDQPQSLRALFDAAKADKTALEHSVEPNSKASRDLVSAAISKLQECQKLVSQLSLFSSNEGLEDIPSGDLQFLTVDYFLAELLQRSSSSDRGELLRRATAEYEKYLTRLDQYELLSASDRKMFEQYLENPFTFSLASKNDAQNRRDIKVARFRQEKELKQKLEYFSQNQTRLQNDDDAVRQLYLAEISLYNHQTFQSLDMISQELEILSQMRNAPPRPDQTLQHDSRRRVDADRTGYTERLDAPLAQLLGRQKGPLLSKHGKPLQPFTLTDRRTELQRGVFRPSHNLPTMSIDEYLEEERKRGGIIEGGNNEQPQEIDEDDMNRADNETMKARAWDEFTEDNPRGSGNTLNRG
ncbi:putative TOR signaling pathway regulator [Talaromyces proteolyticus]|uniref:TOR signaling pathway regulator n=1 Tax=Talaromyces proteolyticus TaxID=1131652 RepID=A0AAD4L1Y6_9EURO|nr:putative TOR signaling pathway regulator [Talaromyces proteolyticus]KAH8705120.1 putative TOR signaling pathway regulator [Talaromyces proteolyticus]